MISGLFDAASVANDRIEELRREAAERRLARSPDNTDESSPRDPQR